MMELFLKTAKSKVITIVFSDMIMAWGEILSRQNKTRNITTNVITL